MDFNTRRWNCAVACSTLQIVQPTNRSLPLHQLAALRIEVWQRPGEFDLRFRPLLLGDPHKQVADQILADGVFYAVVLERELARLDRQAVDQVYAERGEHWLARLPDLQLEGRFAERLRHRLVTRNQADIAPFGRRGRLAVLLGGIGEGELLGDDLL